MYNYPRPKRKRKALRICLVAEEYPGETGWGGIGTYHYNLARGFIALECTVVVIARALERESVVTDDGVTVYRILPVFREHAFLQETVGYRIAVARKLLQVIAEHHIDLIETPEWKAETALFNKVNPGVPLAVRMHSPFSVIRRINGQRVIRPEQRLQEYLEYELINTADYVSSSSTSLLTLAKRYGQILRPVESIVNPANNVDFSPGAVPEALRRRYRGYRHIVLYVGRIERRKGVTGLAKAVPHVIARHPKTLFLFVGRDTPTGPGGSSFWLHTLQGCAERHVSSMQHEEFVEYLNLKNYYNLADVCVFPSLYENFPAVCLEALSCGCAVIGSKHGGMAEMIDDGYSGYLIDPRRVTQIAARINSLLSSEELRQRLGRNALLRIEKQFDRVRATKLILNRYLQVVARCKV